MTPDAGRMTGSAQRRRLEMKRHEKAFTLIELLVIMAMIATLASMLLPSLQYAHGVAMETKCAGQLKQLGDYSRMYMDDHEGFWPCERKSEFSYVWALWGAGCLSGDNRTSVSDYRNWLRNGIRPKFLLCPKVDEFIPPAGTTVYPQAYGSQFNDNNAGDRFASFNANGAGMNTRLPFWKYGYKRNGSAFTQVSTQLSPSRQVLFCDSMAKSESGTTYQRANLFTSDDALSTSANPTYGAPTLMHRGRILMLNFAGGVAFSGESEFLAEYYFPYFQPIEIGAEKNMGCLRPCVYYDENMIARKP